MTGMLRSLSVSGETLTVLLTYEETSLASAESSAHAETVPREKHSLLQLTQKGEASQRRNDNFDKLRCVQYGSYVKRRYIGVALRRHNIWRFSFRLSESFLRKKREFDGVVSQFPVNNNK
jgi:hypothetical protein